MTDVEGGTASLRRMVASTGHDLMQPLQVITAALERLAGLSLGEADRFWLDVANSETRRISAGLHDLVSASRREQAGPSRTRFCLASLLDDLEADWSGPAKAGGVRLTVVRSSIIVASDRSRLRSILDNLIGNAIKYSPSGRIVVGCRGEQGRVRLQVADNGCGIAATERELIFSDFYQIDCSRPGIGLGLSLVRQNCEELGHHISISSIPERGTCFSLLMDRADPR